MNEVHYMSKTNEWSTPQDLFDELDHEFHFTLDPCCTHENAKCKKHFTQRENGLGQSWEGETVFMNPPYGRQIGRWVRKAATENALTVALIPSRTDTSYWHDYIWDEENNRPRPGVSIRFLRGRIKFGDMDKDAPFPSCVVIFRNTSELLQARTMSLPLFLESQC